MRFLTIYLGLFILMTGCKGDQGEQGPKGDPGDLGEVNSQQVLDKLKEVDGEGSGLDADTVDGSQLQAVLDRITALETQVADLSTRLETAETTITAFRSPAGAS